MSFKPGDTYSGGFTTQNSTTSTSANADSLPTGYITHNGTIDGTVVPVITLLTGKTGAYSYVFTIPLTYSAGDTVAIYVNVIVNAVGGSDVLDVLVLDKYRLADQPLVTAVLTALDSQIVHSGTSQGAGSGNNTIVLESSATATNNYYNNLPIKIVSGTGAGQPANLIQTYSGGNKQCVCLNNWITNPDSTSVYAIGVLAVPTVNSANQVIAASVTANVNANVVDINGTAATSATAPPTAAQIAAAILVNPANLLVTNSSGQVDIDLTQSVPTTGNTPHTIGDALNAARAQGFGPWWVDTVHQILYLYASDGTTVVRQFNLDSLAPTTRRT